MIRSLVIMLIVIIVFYVIATVAIKLVDKIRTMDTKVEQLEEGDASQEKENTES